MSLKVIGAVLAMAAGLANSAVHAAQAADAADGTALSEVVVTAERREESAQSVGIAMSVLSGDSLADRSVVTVNDLQNATPSLQVEPAFGSGQPQFRIRGVGFLDYTSNNASPIGVSVDEVPLALPIQTQGQLFDIDRVEVLRGPQGTLYGRNTTGGEINFISNRPTEETHAGVTAEYGSHNEFRGEGFVTGTLAPGLTGRLSAATEQGGAWQWNRDTGARLGGKDTYAVRGQLVWKPSEALNFRLNLHLAEDKSDETGLHLFDAYTPYNGGKSGPTIPADTSRYVTGWQLDPAFARAVGINGNSKPGLDNSNDGIDLQADVDLGLAKLTAIGSYDKMIRREYSDWDATAYYDSDEYFRSYFDVFSQELRIASTGTGPLGWVGGVFYSDQHLSENFYSDFSDANIGFPPDTGTTIVLTNYRQKAESFGVFGQANYQFSDRFKGVLGVREDHESRELLGLNTGVVVGPTLPSFTGGALDRSISSNLPSGKAELDFISSTGTLLYASVSRGVKSGGFTAHNTTSGSQPDPFEPERLTAYELGAKADVTRTLRIDGAVFAYQYRAQQILGKVLDPVSGSYIGRFGNANARLHGADLDVEWHPLTGLSVSQYAGFVEGYYTSALYNSDTPPVNYDGRPESVPKWSYGGDASYGWHIGGYMVTADSNYSFHDTYSQFFLLGSDAFTRPKYWLANANLSFAPAGGAPWSVTLWGRNIFNREYDVTRNFFLPGTNVAQAGEPATFGIRASYKY